MSSNPGLPDPAGHPSRCGARLSPLFAALALLAASFPLAGGVDLAPVADVHTHYKTNQAEVTSPREAVAALDRNGVALAVVIGTPPEYALRLRAAGGDRIIPFYSPYAGPGGWYDWPHDSGLPARVRAALASGEYRGIGELHLIAGFAPHWRTPVISALIALAAEFDVPLLLHTEASRPDQFLDMCRHNPDVRFLWAHAGAILDPGQVDMVMSACPNVTMELSARDPWRYVDNPITDAQGQLLPRWRALVLKYQDRTMVGSDAVWPVERMNPWDEPDTGWEHLDRFIAFHRRWLAGLPPAVESKVRIENARRLFGMDPGP